MKNWSPQCLSCPQEVGLRMNYTTLLKMLIELEKAIGTEPELSIRARIQELENLVLDTQKKRIEELRMEHRNFAA